MPDCSELTAGRQRVGQRVGGSQTARSALIVAACITLAAGMAGGTAGAQSVCVVCEAPAQSYSCSYAPEDAGAGGAARGERALQVRCITELAKLYGHARCRVNANSFGVCAGEVHMLREGGGAAAVPATPAEGGAAGAPDGQAADPDRAETAVGAPKTVVEMARRAAGATREQIEESSQGVEDALRQTWRCVTSLFSRCSDGDAGASGNGQ